MRADRRRLAAAKAPYEMLQRAVANLFVDR
jgi:hypothetical protein